MESRFRDLPYEGMCMCEIKSFNIKLNAKKFYLFIPLSGPAFCRFLPVPLYLDAIRPKILS